MVYNDFKGIKLSALGFGTMRLPVLDGDNNRIDQPQVQQMTDYAMEHGVNYYDTAWGYHGGNSETSIGEALSKHPREKFYIADKFPGYDVSNFGKAEEIFEEQLKKCRVDYFDFYLFHNVAEKNIKQYLDADGEYKTAEFLKEQVKNGRIKHLGFSCHGALPVLEAFLEKYSDIVEFCQLQLNWLDWKFQHCDEKVALLNKYNIPVWVMEPLRGGSLVKLAEEDIAELKKIRPDESVPGWSFRFLQANPSIKMILSGMSDFSQMKQNIEIFDTYAPLNESERGTLLELAQKMLSKNTVPCTACRYCTTHCPMELDIPYLLEYYNEHRYSNGGFLAPMAISCLPREKRPTACIACGSCAAVCPQNIDIPGALDDFCKILGIGKYKPTQA